MAYRVGQQLGNYQLIRLLGEGGFAEVYLGQHIHLDTQAAIKVLHTQLSSDDVDKFRTEARTIAHLVHPNIVRVLEFGVEGKTPFLVMDFASNGTVRQRHPKGTLLPLATIVSYVKQVADALQYAHDEKLIHRDVKPENMLLGRRREVLLSDFGIALVAQSSRYQSTQDMAGTMAYMAPEQIQGKPRPASDQYSLGIVVYEWLSGDRPFHGSFTELVGQHLSVPPPPLRSKVPTIPPDVEQVVRTALAKDPKDRFSSVQAFAKALEQANQTDTLTFVKPPTPVVQQPRMTIPPNRELPLNVAVTPPNQPPQPPVGSISSSGQQRTTQISQMAGFAQPLQSKKAPQLGLIMGTLFLLIMLVGGGIFFFATNKSHLGVSSNSGVGETSKAPANQQIVAFPEAGISDINTFDPGLSTDLPSIQAIDLVFTGLVQLDDNGRVQDQLAQSHQLMPDGLTWKFTLRPNLKFSDGTPLTSADVAYSIDRALQPAEKSTVSPIYLALIKDSDKLLAGKIKTIIDDSLLTPDPNTIEIVTNKKAAYFLDALIYSCSYVVEKSLVEKYGNLKFTDHLTEGGGDGPFKVAEYTHGQHIVFVPNPNYYGPIPQLKKVVYLFYKDIATVYKAYQVNQLDSTGALSIPPTQLAAAKQLTNEFHQVPQLWINYYTMNYLVKPFDNIKIRQAFELAINKDMIVHSVWSDSLVATNHIVPSGMPGYSPNLTEPGGVKGTAGDPAMAKTLFQQGLQEEGLTLATLPPIRLTYASGNKDQNNEVAALQQMWQSTLGVSVKADPIDFNKLLAEIQAALNNPNGLQFWGIAWIADYPDPQDWTTLQFDKGVPNNQLNYGQNTSSDAAQQQAVQKQLEAADVMPPGDARLQAYMTAEQQLVNDVAWLPMEQVTVNLLRKPCVAGVVDNPQGIAPPNDWAAVYITTATPCADTSSFQ